MVNFGARPGASRKRTKEIRLCVARSLCTECELIL